MDDRKIIAQGSYRLTQQANGLVRIDGEISLGDGSTHEVILMVDPFRLMKRMLLRAKCNTCNKTLAMGGSLSLAVIEAVEP